MLHFELPYIKTVRMIFFIYLRSAVLWPTHWIFSLECIHFHCSGELAPLFFFWSVIVLYHKTLNGSNVLKPGFRYRPVVKVTFTNSSWVLFTSWVPDISCPRYQSLGDDSWFFWFSCLITFWRSKSLVLMEARGFYSKIYGPEWLDVLHLEKPFSCYTVSAFVVVAWSAAASCMSRKTDDATHFDCWLDIVSNCRLVTISTPLQLLCTSCHFGFC